jgi:nucleotide-binding universal stress UspA family protein
MKFLLCTDGSEQSREILAPARQLAEAVGAELALIRVLDPRVDAASVIAPNAEEALAQVEAAWRSELSSILSNAGLTGEVLVPRRERARNTQDAICATAEATGATLIAMTSRGAGRVRHALFGSVAMGVLTAAPVPVLTLAPSMPNYMPGSGPYHLAITSDGSPDSRSVFTGIAPLLAAGTLRVTLIQALVSGTSEAEAAALSALNALLPRVAGATEASAQVVSVSTAAAVPAALGEVARRLGADAIAAATHGHSARRHLFAGSTALGLVEKSGLPVILVKSSPVD